MAKKKNKTLASTRKKEETAGNKQQEQKKKGLKKIISRYKKPPKNKRDKADNNKLEKKAAIIPSVPKAEKQSARNKLEDKKAVIEKKEAVLQKKAELAEKAENKKAHEKIKEKNEPNKSPVKPLLTPKRKQQITGLTLMAIGLSTLTFIGFFLFGKIFSPQPIAELLPANKTIALFEFNVNAAHSQPGQFLKLMEKYPVYQSENIVALLNALLPYDYATEIEPWLGRNIGFASYGTENGFTPFSLIFIESIDHQKTVETLRNHALSQANDELAETEINGYKTYNYTATQPGAFTFVKNYLVYAPDANLMNNFLSEMGNSAKLSADDKYIKIRNNLPQQSLVFGYVNYNKLLNTLLQDKKFVAQKGQDLVAIKPFLDVFESAGLTIFAEKNRLAAQTFTTINNKILPENSYITFSEKYQGKLLEIANEEPILLAAGHDLTKELYRLEDIFKSGTKTPALVFEGMLEAQKQRYFGNNIDFKEDIYPLLKGEYLFMVENSFEEPVISTLIELTDKNADIPKLEKAVSQFVSVSGIFTPRINQVTLPDGTIGKEIIASPEKISSFENTYNGKKYTSMRIGDTGKQINYAVIDDVAVFSNSEATVKNIMDRMQGNEESGYTKTRYFQNHMRPVLRTADEMMHVKLGAVTELLQLNEDKTFAAYLVPFTNFAVAKNFFTDGISTIYLIEVI
jgi:hypothetical protein